MGDGTHYRDSAHRPRPPHPLLAEVEGEFADEGGLPGSCDSSEDCQFSRSVALQSLSQLRKPLPLQHEDKLDFDLRHVTHTDFDPRDLVGIAEFTVDLFSELKCMERHTLVQ